MAQEYLLSEMKHNHVYNSDKVEIVYRRGFRLKVKALVTEKFKGEVE